LYWLHRWVTRVGVATASPVALQIVAVYVVLWLIFDPSSLNWQAGATIATWIMTLFIQRAETRDTLAIHAKLDELLRAEGRARSELTRLDEREPEEIAEHRDQEKRAGVR
jgi:low affinity Fe/Cu permease